MTSRPQQPGPYLYPPTLALLIAELGITPLLFVGLSLLSILGWSWLWLRSTGLHPLSLLLICGSLDVAASLNAGNVEPLLLLCALAAAWLLWHAHPVVAAPLLIALTLVVKPFYPLFFVAVALLLLVAQPQPGAVRWHELVRSTLLVAVLVLLEVLRWGPTLRTATLHYLTHALDYQWFGLPVAEQTPVSQWNRTPLQAVVVLGVEPRLAQRLALGLWLIALLVTLLQLRGCLRLAARLRAGVAAAVLGPADRLDAGVSGDRAGGDAVAGMAAWAAGAAAGGPGCADALALVGVGPDGAGRGHAAGDVAAAGGRVGDVAGALVRRGVRAGAGHAGGGSRGRITVRRPRPPP